MVGDPASTNLELDLQKVDHFAHLALWGAPWQKAWLELALLENRWDAETIASMVQERTGYPDYAAKVTQPYPQEGWVSDLLESTKPNPMASQFLAMVISNMADGVAQNMKLPVVPKETSVSTTISDSEAEAIYEETIKAFAKYVPRDLDPAAVVLYRSTIDLSIQTLKMALSSHLLMRGRREEAEQSFPGISKLTDPVQSKEAVSDLLEKAVSLMLNNIEMSQLQSGDEPA